MGKKSSRKKRNKKGIPIPPKSGTPKQRSQQVEAKKMSDAEKPTNIADLEQRQETIKALKNAPWFIAFVPIEGGLRAVQIRHEGCANNDDFLQKLLYYVCYEYDHPVFQNVFNSFIQREKEAGKAKATANANKEIAKPGEAIHEDENVKITMPEKPTLEEVVSQEAQDAEIVEDSGNGVEAQKESEPKEEEKKDPTAAEELEELQAKMAALQARMASEA